MDILEMRGKWENIVGERMARGGIDWWMRVRRMVVDGWMEGKEGSWEESSRVGLMNVKV